MAGSGVARPRRGGLHAPRHAQHRRLPLRRRRSGVLRPVDPAAARRPAVSARQRAPGRAVAAVRVRRAARPRHRRGTGKPRDVVPRALPADAGAALRRAGPHRRSTARLALVDRRVRRRRDDSPPHRQDGRQHARGLLPPAAAGVRDRPARPRRGTARPAGTRARGGRGRRRHPPDDRDLVRRLDWRRARRRAAAAAAGAGPRCGHRPRRRAGPAGRGLPPGPADGRRVAVDAGRQGLSVRDRLGHRAVGAERGVSRGDRGDLPGPSPTRADAARRARAGRRLPGPGRRLRRDAAAGRRARRRRGAAPGVTCVLDGRHAGHARHRVVAGRSAPGIGQPGGGTGRGDAPALGVRRGGRLRPRPRQLRAARRASRTPAVRVVGPRRRLVRRRRVTCAGPRRPAPTSSPTPTMPCASARRSACSPPATCSWRTSRTRR